ncbi:MAG: spore coat protein U domain-containing protein [Gallionella sp.]|nr:spore coat protein U domain-containing protein [Gallionella sp.]
MKKSLLTASILAAGLAFSGASQAVVVASSTLNVSATVAVDCAVTTTAVNFGSLTATQYSTASGNVSVTCTTGTPYTITLDGGLNSPNTGTRSMKHSVDGVSLAVYALTSDIGLITPWGDSGFASTYPWGGGVADTSNGAAQPHPVYGQASATSPLTNLPSPAGVYSDTVNVTVNY